MCSHSSKVINQKKIMWDPGSRESNMKEKEIFRKIVRGDPEMIGREQVGKLWEWFKNDTDRIT